MSDEETFPHDHPGDDDASTMLGYLLVGWFVAYWLLAVTEYWPGLIAMGIATLAALAVPLVE